MFTEVCHLANLAKNSPAVKAAGKAKRRTQAQSFNRKLERCLRKHFCKALPAPLGRLLYRSSTILAWQGDRFGRALLFPITINRQ